MTEKTNETTEERTFPVKDRKARTTTHVSWEIAEAAYAAYVDRYGKVQTLERITARGGFYAEEMDNLLPDWRERHAAERKRVECHHCAGTGKTAPQFNSLEELAAFIEKEPREWRPGYYYNGGGDQLECYWENVATVADLSLEKFGIILHRAHDGDNCGPDLSNNRVVGVTLIGIVGRIALEASQKAYSKPHPSSPLHCPVCKAEAPRFHGRTMIYSAEKIECENCGHKYTTEEGRATEVDDG